MNPGGTHAPYSLSRGAPSATWVLLHGGRFVFPSLSGWIKWRRERDSNPRCLSASLVFKTSAFNRSAISPCCGTSESYYNSFLPERQSSFCKKSKKLGFAGFDWLPAVVCLLQWAETQTGAAQNAALLETSTIESARLHGSSCA